MCETKKVSPSRLLDGETYSIRFPRRPDCKRFPRRAIRSTGKPFAKVSTSVGWGWATATGKPFRAVAHRQGRRGTFSCCVCGSDVETFSLKTPFAEKVFTSTHADGETFGKVSTSLRKQRFPRRACQKRFPRSCCAGDGETFSTRPTWKPFPHLALLFISS